MRIVPKERFLIGCDRFDAGLEYIVSDTLGVHSILNGWATSDDVDTLGVMVQGLGSLKDKKK